VLGSRQVRGRKRGAGAKGRDGALSWPGIDHGNPEVPYYNPHPSLYSLTKQLEMLPFVVAKFTFCLHSFLDIALQADLSFCNLSRLGMSNY
jgi:hypothetical protein